MRAFKFLLFFFFITSFLIASKALAEAAFNPYRKFCTGIQGKFIARNWKGGPIQVGCAGDSGSYTSNPDQRCVGEVQTVYPGEKFRLTKCSCFGSDKGCLKVGKELRREPLVNGKRKITVVRRIQDMAAFTNNSCTINKTSNICGSNGDRIKGNVKIRCQVPLTPTPPICPVPEKVTNVRVNCPNCFGEVEPTPTPTITGAPISAFIESGGSVVMETENNDGKFNRNGYRWDGAAPGSPQTATDGWHGDGYIAARPNDDLRVFFANGYLDAPEVVYNVNFTTTGTYFVYLRSSGPDAKSDSAHVGLDGALNGSMALYFIGEGGATSNWKWRSNNNDGTRTKINVSTPGIHTFHIFMREDGTRIDRIRLSTNKDWVANPNDSAKGPDESPRGTF